MTDPTTEDHEPDPVDRLASDALDARMDRAAPPEMDDSQRARMHEMARARARLREDPGTLTPEQTTTMVEEALRVTRDPASDGVAPVPSSLPGTGTRGTRRPSVAWIGAAAAALVLVVALSVVAGTRGPSDEEQSSVALDSADEDTARGSTADVESDAGSDSVTGEAGSVEVPPLEEDSPGAAATTEGVDLDDDGAPGDRPGAPTTRLPPVPSAQESPETTSGRAAAVAGIRLTVVVHLP